MRMKKTSRKQLRILRRRRLALALVGAMAMPMMPAVAQSLPNSGSVVNGTATINQAGTSTTITQTTKGAIIDWGSFNIGAGYGVTFDQQFGTTSVTLNRVVGTPGVSMINGTLTSNGSVFIINPAGITFGSGAQVNVGGLIASTLAISNADFLSGLSSGQYRFSASASDAGAILNSGQLTAADGGTIGLIGSYIHNAGTITANLGSVVFGATSQVTLDFFGDGLTQVTVSGNGLGRSNCVLNCTGGINSSGNVFARGGHIEMRSNTMDGQSAGNALFVDPANGGRIWISGNVAAQTSGSRRGSVVIDAGMGNIDLGGVQGKTANVSANAINAGEQAGTVQLRGNQLFTYLCVWTNGACENNNQLGFINASTYGGGGLAGGTIDIEVGRLYHAGVIQASSATGAGGTVNINANSAEIYNLVFAEGYGGGSGGSININANSLLLHRGITPWIDGGPNYSLATLSAFGSTSGGTVNIDAAGLSMVDLGTVSPDDVNLDPAYRPTINVNGYGGNGGSINVTTSNFSLSPWQYFEATGTQAGGNIAITADSIDLAGGLVATGASGGTVTTTTTSSLFAAATAYINAGTWLVHAPSVDIVPTSGAVPGSGAVLTDDALSSTLDGGTVIQLYADASLAPGASGSIHIDGGVDIVHATAAAAALDLRATAGIYGGDFSITSSGGPLDLSFTANVAGNNPNDGYVSFYGITLGSNGGDIDMHADGSGVYLEYSDLSSGAGDITLFGSGEGNGVLLRETGLASTGGDISITAASVYGASARLILVDIASGGGDIAIDGDGPDGVWVVYSDVSSGGGNIAIHGDGIYSGTYFHDTTIDSADGDIAISGSASQDVDGYYPFGVALAGTTLTSTTGDISVVGDAIGGSGILFWTPGSIAPTITTTSGAIMLTSTGANGLGLEGLGIATDTGDITIVGTATDVDATAAVFVSSSGLQTNGGDITITGTNAGGTGVWVYQGDLSSNGGDITIVGEGFHYGVQVWDSLVSSGVGDTAVTGTATGSDSTGVNVRDGAFASTSGDITITGDAEYGEGMFFGTTGSGSGSSVTTSSGAISVISTGLSGLNASDVPFTTDTGSITLQGTALGDDFGVYVGAGGLSTNGGDITIIGSSTSYTGVWVYGGNIASNGGDIVITGSSDSGAGFAMDQGSSIDAGDGLVTLVAGNSGVSDAIVLGGSISSNTGVNLRPLDTTDAILLGSGTGFALDAAELVLINSPELVIGSAQHAGAIRVQQAVTRDGNLTLQNQGGSGGIDLQAAIDIGSHTLALATGGDIIQATSGAITANSLLALAAGDMLLGTAQNDVASTTLAGSSGGDFEFLDASALSIGTVSARGIDTASGQLSGLGASGITAGGDALVRNLAGDLTLQSGISAHAIDLVTAGALQNTAGATLTAANGWRVWASSWVGETRGGLAGNGALPNLYGCTFNGACAATAPAADGNYFIYQQQPTAIILIGNATREYGLANPAFTYSVTGAVLGDGQGSLASGTPTSAATIGSNVGAYSITGNFISPAGYALQFAPGTLSITPATLVFTADEMLRYFGFGNPDFTGSFSGFRNGDTLQSAFANGVSIYSPAESGSIMGYYPIYASGNALNYVIQQAPGNGAALQIVPAPQFASALTEFVSDAERTYVYENNIARDWMCPLGTPAEDEPLQASGDDDLGRDWLKVRRRLQLNNCIDSANTPGCRF